MKRKIFFGFMVVCASLWSFAYLRHFSIATSLPEDGLEYQLTLAETVDNFNSYVLPILDRKCAGCHTDTEDRPFFYYIPVLSRITQPYTESKLEKALAHFDFSDGLITNRLGGTFEMTARLIDIIKNDTMPPIEYAVARPHMLLNESEKQTISAWAESTARLILAQLTDPSGEHYANTSHASTSKLPSSDPDDFGETMAEQLIAACPITSPGDLAARDACAVAVVENEIFRTRMNNPFLWGGQSEVGEYRPWHSDINRFNPLLWRKYYLSLFMFEGGYDVARQGDITVYRFPVRFRSDLGDGEYPYPFWHSDEKWRRYNEAAELMLLTQSGRIIGAFRSAASRPSPHSWSERIWNKEWLWKETALDKAPMPRVTNYDTLLSAGNPYLDELAAAYQELALNFRNGNCVTCHSPDNTAGMNVLEILSSPGHALSARRRLETVIAANEMPPVTGIEDRAELEMLLEAARRFREVGDRAMQFEGEQLDDTMDRPVVPNQPTPRAFDSSSR